jgi:hypothetical protein
MISEDLDQVDLKAGCTQRLLSRRSSSSLKIDMERLKHITKLKGARIHVIGGASGMGCGVADALIDHGAPVFVSSPLIQIVKTGISKATPMTWLHQSESLWKLRIFSDKLLCRTVRPYGIGCDSLEPGTVFLEATRMLRHQ